MVRRISGSGFELDQNKVQLRSPSALQGRIYYYLWCKCFSCLIRIDSVRFSCFCYVNNNQQNLIFSREIILVFSPSPSLRLPQISSGPMANPTQYHLSVSLSTTTNDHLSKKSTSEKDIYLNNTTNIKITIFEDSNLGITGN